MDAELAVEAEASMTSSIEAAAPFPPLPLPTLTPPPAPLLAIGAQVERHGAGRGGIAVHQPDRRHATLAAPLFEPLTWITLPPPPLAVAVRFINVPVDIALIDEIRGGAAAAANPLAVPPPLAVVLIVIPLGPF